MPAEQVCPALQRTHVPKAVGGSERRTPPFPKPGISTQRAPRPSRPGRAWAGAGYPLREGVCPGHRLQDRQIRWTHGGHTGSKKRTAPCFKSKTLLKANEGSFQAAHACAEASGGVTGLSCTGVRRACTCMHTHDTHARAHTRVRAHAARPPGTPSPPPPHWPRASRAKGRQKFHPL